MGGSYTQLTWVGQARRLPPQQAVQGMIRVIDTLTPEKNGRFFTWQGQEQVW